MDQLTVILKKEEEGCRHGQEAVHGAFSIMENLVAAEPGGGCNASGDALLQHAPSYFLLCSIQ